MNAGRHFLAHAPTPPEGWRTGTLAAAADRAKAAGYTALRLDATWAALQPSGPGPLDFSSMDLPVQLVRAKGLVPIVGINHAVPPDWVDADEYGLRDPNGRPVTAVDGDAPRLTLNAKQVRDWVGDLFRLCASHWKGGVTAYVDLSPHLAEARAHRPGGPALDHSPRCAAAYRMWLRAKHVDVRTLNTAWDTAYQGWDDIPPGEGARKSSQADFHLFRYSTLASWAEFLRKAVDAGDPGAAYAFRGAGWRKPSELGGLAFDLGRAMRGADWYLGDETTDPWALAMVRSAAELWQKRWGADAAEPGWGAAWPGEEAAKEVPKWGKAVYDQGGMLMVRQPVVAAPGKAMEAEVRKVLPLPQPPPRNNRRAVYVSAAEAQFWDGTDHDEARGVWWAATEGGKKTTMDVVSDGVFAGSPGTLSRYSAGIEIVYAKVIARDARAALIQAGKNGIRLVIHRPELAGTLDEHGKPQAPLAG